MNLHLASRAVAVTLISLLPVCAHSAEAERSKTASVHAAVSDEDLQAASERIRKTGEQIRENLKEARARLDAEKAERKREAERARQQAIKEAADEAAIKEAKRQEAAQAQARREAAKRAEQAELERQTALAEQRARDEQAARERAAKALMEARKSVGPKALAEDGI